MNARTGQVATFETWDTKRWAPQHMKDDPRMLPIGSAMVVVDLATGNAVMRATIHRSKAGVFRCALWTDYIDAIGSARYGFGRAGGYGYCKASAALADAIDKAGIGLSEPIDGRGEQAMRGALVAIAHAAGWLRVTVVTV